MESYLAFVDIFAPFDNILGFFIASDVPNSTSNTNSSPFVKAAVRDVKAYMSAKNYRQIPVGYAAEDDAQIRSQVAAYFQCGSIATSIDFYGLDNYEWCGQSSFQASGYENLTQDFVDYPLPAIFSEFGCNSIEPRSFTEVQALYGPEMTDVWSGGIVYEWFELSDGYGLVTQIGTSVSLLPDYTSLSVQFRNATPSSTNSENYNPTNVALPCPMTSPSTWVAATNLPPTPNKELCDCVELSLGCVATGNATTNMTTFLNFLNYLCENLAVNCSMIEADGNAPGSYGIYSPCNDSVQLSWEMNTYWESQAKVSGACDFSGGATTQSTRPPSGTCASLLDQATRSIPSATGEQTSTGTMTGFPQFFPF
jgi:1,3-beta-glucanosyltransferase GAS1